MAEIGTEMIRSNQNYEDVFKHAMGPANAENKCNLDTI